MNKRASIAIGLGIMALLAVCPLFLNNYWLLALNNIGLYAILALSLNIVLGQTGLFNMGHTAFYAVGAYTAAILNTKLGIPALLSGILTMIALFSINLRVMTKANISLLRMDTVYTPLMSLGLNKTWAVIALGAMCAALVIGLLYWFFGTEVGSAIRATGANPNMVRAQGIHTDTTLILGLMISNALVGISGSLIAQSQNYADLQMGTGSIVIGLASMIIGEVLFGKRNFFLRFLSMVLGAITYRIIIALVLKMGMPSDDLKLFTAITVVFALSLPKIKGLINGRLRPRKGGM